MEVDLRAIGSRGERLHPAAPLNLCESCAHFSSEV
jgi:hypothetical protein